MTQQHTSCLLPDEQRMSNKKLELGCKVPVPTSTACTVTFSGGRARSLIYTAMTGSE
jgi:hypothetical protein